MAIVTDRLRLRPWQEADKSRFAEITNTPAMMAHMGGVRTREDIDAIVDAQIQMQRVHGLSMWAMALRDGGDVIGICGLRYAGHPGTPVEGELEIGWRVAEPFWGQGYAKEAAAASLDWGWEHTTRVASRPGRCRATRRRGGSWCGSA